MISSVYISGPMEGIKNYEENFRKAEKKLIKEGYEVTNPADIDVTGMSRDSGHGPRNHRAMRRNIHAQGVAAVPRREPGVWVCAWLWDGYHV